MKSLRNTHENCFSRSYEYRSISDKIQIPNYRGLTENDFGYYVTIPDTEQSPEGVCYNESWLQYIGLKKYLQCILPENIHTPPWKY